MCTYRHAADDLLRIVAIKCILNIALASLPPRHRLSQIVRFTSLSRLGGSLCTVTRPNLRFSGKERTGFTSRHKTRGPRHQQAAVRLP